MTPEHEAATAELGTLFGCAGHTQAEIAWFMFGLGQLGVLSQVNPGQARLLIGAMRKDIEDLRDRSNDLIVQMEQMVSSLENLAIDNEEESDEDF